jgi:predicted phage terminase large subunit-like protein
LLASLPPEQLAAFLKRTSDRELEAIEHDWGWWGRPNQQAPKGDWRTWLLLAGRGFGKTRSGAECIRDQVIHHRRRRIALVAPTAADARDVMVEGESGLLAIGPPQQRPQYEPTKRRLTWPNGAIATTYSADEPERLRGPQHDAAWCDEIASWRYPEAWDMLMFGLRLGNDPRAVVTTTPKPVKIIRELLTDPTTVVTRGSSYENRANLADAFFAQIVRKYEGTRLGRQELNAELLDDVPGALWNRARLEELRWPVYKAVPELTRIVVAIDPAVSSGEDANETGIVVAGKDAGGRGFVLADRSGHYTPTEWAQLAIALYRQHKADRIVAEVNNGGQMVENTIRMISPDGPNIPYTAVYASRGKVVRAEPVAALYEQEPGRVFHVGAFPTLEDQMCGFTTDLDRKSAKFSPDRVDALVWAFTELLVDQMEGYGIFELQRRQFEEMERKKAEARKRPEPVYAKGSMEYERQQEAKRLEREQEAKRQEQQGNA